MNIKQGDKFQYENTNGDQETVEIISTIGDHVGYKHIQGRSASTSIHEDFFQQLIKNGYFKRMGEDA
ncbi:hypothetical protein [Salinicoccus carnicancri]|uniref:hypothetical protein n=1 Tax=Salinicoccus carnicancri TaxID=558170 RepID=UPI000300D413|nr:hypothetical protein [Salinicoccus carnicancri]